VTATRQPRCRVTRQVGDSRVSTTLPRPLAALVGSRGFVFVARPNLRGAVCGILFPAESWRFSL